MNVVEKVKGACAMLAILTIAVLLLPGTARAAEAASEEGWDERAQEAFQELMDIMEDITWIGDEAKLWNLEEYSSEYSSDISERVPWIELSSTEQMIYIWSYGTYMDVIKDPIMFTIDDTMESRETFHEFFDFWRWKGADSDEAMDSAVRKVVDFQYDYMLAHGNEPYDFTRFIRNDAIVVGPVDPGPAPSQGVSQEPSGSGSLEPDPGLVLPSGAQSQEVRDQEVPQEGAEGGGGSPWKAVMDRLAGLMLTLLILAVSGIALAVVVIRRKKKGD